MNLALDFGNTRIKAGVFEGKKLVKHFIVNSNEELLHSKDLKGINNCIIGSVTDKHSIVFENFSKKFNTLVFKSTTPIPLKNLYKSALSLGSDRLATSVGAYTLFPDQNVLTIDAGTCIKYNFVNAGNEYLGGAISPGINMRLKAMHHYTHALPVVEMDKNYVALIGQSTHGSMLSGSLIAAVCEVDAMIKRYSTEFNQLQVVLTGGDSDYLGSQLKNRFFASQTILLEGLNAILNFNSEN
jgi:type III pantothenate kinase